MSMNFSMMKVVNAKIHTALESLFFIRTEITILMNLNPYTRMLRI